VDINEVDIQLKLDAAIDHIERVSSMRFGEDGTYKYLVYCLPFGNSLPLPVYPILSIESVLIETSGYVPIVIPDTDYSLDNITHPNRITLINEWQNNISNLIVNQFTRTIIDFTAGFSTDTLPPLAKECILLLASDFYEYRIESITQRLQRIPMGLKRMLISLSKEFILDRHINELFCIK